MFGYVNINKAELKMKDYDYYHSVYCGLCHELKHNYGQLSRLALNYDLCFVAILLTSLYELEVKSQHKRCMLHPLSKHEILSNEAITYACDMTIVLTYFKCKDNYEDENDYKSRLYQRLLKNGFNKVKSKYPDKIDKITNLLKENQQLEQNSCYDLDALSKLSGQMMGEVVCMKQDEFYDSLYQMADYLGRYIYLLDAYDDLNQDIKKGCFNPLMKIKDEIDFDEIMKKHLEMMISLSSLYFEKLPIIEHVDLLRNIMYSGVWFKYELIRKRKGEDNGPV